MKQCLTETHSVRRQLQSTPSILHCNNHVSDVVDEDIIVLYGGQRLTLLNSNQVAVEKGQIITAGSNVCKSSCDKYNGQLKKG